MNNFNKKDLGKGTFQFELSIPKKDIKKDYDEAFGKMQAELEITGFRRGNVPKKIAEKHLKKEDIFKKVIDTLLPRLYQDLVKKENLKPVITPKVELLEAKEDSDWKIRITVAERPRVNLGDWKKQITSLNKEEKKGEIWTPGKPISDEDKGEVETKRKELLNKILTKILEVSNVEVSELIIEDEVNRRLSQLVDDVRKAGLTMENYLRSKGETIESVRERYKKEIEEMYRLEFALEDISEAEKITITPEELDKFFTSIQDEGERERAKQNSYFYAAVIRRQKTLDFIINL